MTQHIYAGVGTGQKDNSSSSSRSSKNLRPENATPKSKKLSSDVLRLLKIIFLKKEFCTSFVKQSFPTTHIIEEESRFSEESSFSNSAAPSTSDDEKTTVATNVNFKMNLDPNHQ